MAASSSPESSRLLVVAVSSPSSSSSVVDASVFNCLSPLKSEKGTYWSRLTETDTTLRSPQPVFASPHLALPQETSLSRDGTLTDVHKHCDSQIDALQVSCSEKVNRPCSPLEPAGVYLADPNTTQLQLKSSNDATTQADELVPLMPSKPAKEEVAGDHWTNKRVDEFISKDVNYVESTMHLRTVSVEQPLGSYSIVLNGMEHNAQNVEENEIRSSTHEFKHIAESTGDHNMGTNHDQRGIRRHLQFEAAVWREVGYGEPGTFRSHYYPPETLRAVSIGSHLNVIEQETKLLPHWSHDLAKNPERNCPSLTVAEQFSAQTAAADSSAGFRAIIPMKPCADSKQFMRVEPNANRFGELNQASPKRRKKESVTRESDDHKGCNCKKSKCLKLYCECFAAGKFCVESCGCTNCFNKPEYEDTIHDTRQQIESRNPLAFAPKVLNHHPMDSPTNIVEDGNGTTPASARHKRGCNCKKSKCHKKYCECYQSGVGCSDGCRCDGCKNSFGAKTAYRRNERWRNQSHEKASPGQARARIKAAGGEHDDTGNAVFFSASSNLQDSRGSRIQVDWQYPLAISTQQVFDSNVLQDLTNEYATCENIMNTEQSQSQSQMMLAIASTPSKALKASLPDKKSVSPITFRSQEPGSSSLRSLRSGGKFILQGLPSFPPLSPYSSGENGSDDMESFANGQ